MYGVCVTFPRVFPAAAVGGGGNGGQNGQINESTGRADCDCDKLTGATAAMADCDNGKPADAAAMAAPVVESPVTVLKPRSGQKGGGGKDRAVRGQSPPRGSGRGGRRGRGNAGGKGGGGGKPDTQVFHAQF